MRQDMGSTDSGNVVRPVALLLGVGYVAIGVIGFLATGFSDNVVADTGADILGFDLNLFHNVVHLSIGAGLILAASLRDISITQGILMGVGLFYILAAILGFINELQLISINDSLSIDNFFHLLTGAIALIFGLVSVRQQNDSLDQGGGRDTRVRPGLRPIGERRAAWDSESTFREETY